MRDRDRHNGARPSWPAIQSCRPHVPPVGRPPYPVEEYPPISLPSIATPLNSLPSVADTGAAAARRASLTLVFDLDGTLVDTAPDLIAATNHTLAALNLPAADDARVRPMVSHGALAMIRAGIGSAAADWPEARLYPLLDVFLAHYEANIAATSRPFPGLTAALDTLAADGHRLAVCTNKRERLAVALLDALGLSARFTTIAGRDTFPVFKPDPGHLTATIARAGGCPTRAVMIGDSGVDVATARNAGVPVIAVGFGYSDPPVATHAPDALIDHYDQLIAAVHAVTPVRG